MIEKENKIEKELKRKVVLEDFIDFLGTFPKDYKIRLTCLDKKEWELKECLDVERDDKNEEVVFSVY